MSRMLFSECRRLDAERDAAVAALDVELGVSKLVERSPLHDQDVVIVTEHRAFTCSTLEI